MQDFVIFMSKNASDYINQQRFRSEFRENLVLFAETFIEMSFCPTFFNLQTDYVIKRFK